MADEQINVKITGDYDDKDAKAAIKDAKEIEKLDPTLQIDGDASDAKSAIEQIDTAAGNLTKADHEITLKAQIAAAKSDLETMQRSLDDVRDHADDANTHMDKLGGEGGLHTRGQAIADLTGPLGDASGAASDFAGLFDGIGDIAGDVATKVGVSAVAMESAIGGIGIVVAAAAAVWTLFTGNQQKAREKQKELVKGQQDYNKALKEGDIVAAAADFDKLYGSGIDGAHQLKISTKDAYEFIANGVPIGTLDDAKAKLAEMQKAYDAYMQTGQGNPDDFAGISNLKNQIDLIEGARSKFVEANGAEGDAAARAKDIQGAMGDALAATTKLGDEGSRKILKLKTAGDQAKASFDLIKIAVQQLQGQLDQEQSVVNFQTSMHNAQQEIIDNGHLSEQAMIDAKQAIIDVGTTAGLTPIQMETEINKITPTDVNTAFYETQALINAHADLVLKAKIQATLDLGTKTHSGAKFGLGPDGELIVTGGSFTPDAPAAPAGPSAPVVNVNLAPGARGVDVLRQVSGQARRSGRRYGTPTVHYARRGPRESR
jgi:hypothetical protein